jgi:fumarylacetoacetate (FAA) hydrolase
MIIGRCELDGRVLIARIEGDLAVPVAEAGPLTVLDVDTHRHAAPIADPVPIADPRWLSPLDPPSLRDFMAFEQHYRNIREKQGLEVEPMWFERPCFYFNNHNEITAHDQDIPVPRGSRAMDYELEIAAIIGTPGRDLDPRDPATLDHIAGFTIYNDWSARDLQTRDMRHQLGPGKGKDYANSLGPWMITPDELPDFATGRPGGAMTARVNGEEWSAGDSKDIYWSWGDILAYGSANATLRPGDVLGSGTCGTGCILELRAAGLRDTRKWLRAGDVVEIGWAPVGTLRNRVVEGNPAPF